MGKQFGNQSQERLSESQCPAVERAARPRGFVSVPAVERVATGHSTCLDVNIGWKASQAHVIFMLVCVISFGRSDTGWQMRLGLARVASIAIGRRSMRPRTINGGSRDTDGTRSAPVVWIRDPTKARGKYHYTGRYEATPERPLDSVSHAMRRLLRGAAETDTAFSRQPCSPKALIGPTVLTAQDVQKYGSYSSTVRGGAAGAHGTETGPGAIGHRISAQVRGPAALTSLGCTTLTPCACLATRPPGPELLPSARSCRVAARNECNLSRARRGPVPPAGRDCSACGPSSVSRQRGQLESRSSRAVRRGWARFLRQPCPPRLFRLWPFLRQPATRAT